MNLSFDVFIKFFSSHKSGFDIVVVGGLKGNNKLKQEIESKNKTKQKKENVIRKHLPFLLVLVLVLVQTSPQHKQVDV